MLKQSEATINLTGLAW